MVQSIVLWRQEPDGSVLIVLPDNQFIAQSIQKLLLWCQPINCSVNTKQTGQWLYKYCDANQSTNGSTSTVTVTLLLNTWPIKTMPVNIRSFNLNIHGIFIVGGCTCHYLKPQSTFRQSLVIWSVALGNQWSAPTKPILDQFHWSAPLVSCNNWSECKTESKSGLGPVSYKCGSLRLCLKMPGIRGGWEGGCLALLD